MRWPGRSAVAAGTGPRVALLAPGLGHVQRGYERFAAELGAALHGTIPLTLFKGGGRSAGHEVRVPTLRRDRLPARMLGALARNRHFFEEYSFGLAVLPALLRGQFDLVHYSEPALNNFFRHLRERLRWPVRTLFSHGVRMAPRDCLRCHHLHQVSSVSHAEALAAGVPADRMTWLPYGLSTDRFAVPPAPPAQLRAELGVPEGHSVVLCAAVIDRRVKRIDYLVDEVAGLGAGWTLVLAGRVEDGSVVQEARVRLGPRVHVLERAFDEMPALYHAADVVCLTSLIEGLPNAILEAMAARRPVVVHESLAATVGHPASLVDMRRRGALAERLGDLRRRPGLAAEMAGANAEAVAGCDWRILAPRYREMYGRVAAEQGPPLDVLLGGADGCAAEASACRA